MQSQFLICWEKERRAHLTCPISGTCTTLRTESRWPLLVWSRRMSCGSNTLRKENGRCVFWRLAHLSQALSTPLEAYTLICLFFSFKTKLRLDWKHKSITTFTETHLISLPTAEMIASFSTSRQSAYTGPPVWIVTKHSLKPAPSWKIYSLQKFRTQIFMQLLKFQT